MTHPPFTLAHAQAEHDCHQRSHETNGEHDEYDGTLQHPAAQRGQPKHDGEL